MRLEYQIIGWRAAILRQLNGLDQKDAAKLAGITLRTWQNMESGRPCQEATVFAVARAFDCPRLWLFGLETRQKEAAS
jgi:transcriptional regulator with XRE-family HTH domain